MAQIERLIPHILLWENGIKLKPDETLQMAFSRAKAKGVVTAKGDLGGPTLCGVTLTTFQDWRRKQGKGIPSKADLARLEYDEWLAILKSIFWDPCQADLINHQSVANMLVDWRWVNGNQAVRDVQTAFCLVPDGVVGPKTIAALNSMPAETVFLRLKAARERSYHKIVERRESQKVNLKGWLNRTNDIKFELYGN